MKIPKSVLIKGQKWKIKRVLGLKDDNGNPCWGICSYDEHTIYIEKDTPEDMLELTLVHELIHAGIKELHLDLDEVTDEILADGLASIFISLKQQL